MSNEPLRIFIGYDPVETVAYHVCCNSILENASVPVSFTPIGLQNMPPAYTRPRGEKDSTEFAICRFLTPWLCNYQGLALFLDCDMVIRGDVAQIFESADLSKAISVVKHDYTPKSSTKFLGQKQERYQRKNWSSVILYNNARCTQLTLDFVSRAPGLDLHQFNWVSDDAIGALDPRWNHLVGEYSHSDDAMNFHFTLGGPYFEEFQNTDHSEDWFAAFRTAIKPLTWPDE